MAPEETELYIVGKPIHVYLVTMLPLCASLHGHPMNPSCVMGWMLTSGWVAELYTICRPNLTGWGQSSIHVVWAHLRYIGAQSKFITLEHDQYNIVTMPKG